MRIITFTIFFIFFNLNLGFSLEKVNEDFVKYVQSQKNEFRNLDDLHEFLIKPAKNERDRAELFFYWIAENISYDVVKYKTISDGERPIDYDILVEKKGVCADYSKLFKSLCDLSDIECYNVSGYAKGLGFSLGAPLKIDHAWNVIRLGDKYEFVDCTWGSGSVVNSKSGGLKYLKEMDLSWVFVDSNKFREFHLPGSPKWQLLNHPVSYDSYLNNKEFLEMYSKEDEEINFRDSIKAFQNLTNEERQIKEIIDFYHFNSTYKNAFECGRTFNIIAYGLMIGNYDLSNLERAKKYYETARKWYLKSFKLINGKRRKLHNSQINFIRNINKGLKYCELRILTEA